jgi:hypothetical protein
MFAGTVAQGTITGFNKGGLIVELDGEDLKGGLGGVGGEGWEVSRRGWG